MKCNIRGEHILRNFKFGSNQSSAYSVSSDLTCRFVLKTLVEELFGLRNARYTFLISNLHRVLNVVFFFFFIISSSEFYVPTFRNTLLCSIFMGGVSRKNNRDEIARVFIQVKVCLKNS
jgi:hypothetical protein